MNPLDVATVELDKFSAHLNSSFSIVLDGDGENLDLKLLEASEYPDHRPEGEREGRKPFSLVFGCASHPLEQGTYQLEHEALGSFVAFLSPFEIYERGHKLEGIFA